MVKEVKKPEPEEKDNWINDFEGIRERSTWQVVMEYAAFAASAIAVFEFLAKMIGF